MFVVVVRVRIYGVCLWSEGWARKVEVRNLVENMMISLQERVCR